MCEYRRPNIFYANTPYQRESECLEEKRSAVKVRTANKKNKQDTIFPYSALHPTYIFHSS